MQRCVRAHSVFRVGWGGCWVGRTSVVCRGRGTLAQGVQEAVKWELFEVVQIDHREQLQNDPFWLENRDVDQSDQLAHRIF